MATSAGGGTGGAALLIGAAAIGAPVIVVMGLAFSDFNNQVDAANSPAKFDVEGDRAASPVSGGAALASFGGVGGASKARPNLFGNAAPPPSRRAEDVDVRIAPLRAGAFRHQAEAETAPAGAPGDDVVLTEAPAEGAPGRMAMLHSGGGQNWGGVQGGGGSSVSGWSGFGGGSGFGGSGSGSGFGGGSQGGSSPQALVPTTTPGAPVPTTDPVPQSPPPLANLTPPPAPPSQPSAPPASPPASGPGPIVLRPGDVLKGDGSSVPVINDGGQLAGGHSPGIWNDEQSYTQNSGETEVEIWGLTGPGVETGYDYYDIVGDAIFNGGTIAFEFITGFDFSQAFELEFLSAGNIEFGAGFEGYTFRYATLSPLDVALELFNVFELVDDNGRERLVLSYFGPQQQVNDQQQNRAPQAPEPEALFLFGLGLLGLVAARRRLA